MNLLRTLLLVLALSASGPTHAHKPSDSYLSINVEGRSVEGRWDIALRDLEFAIGLDADGNGEITWGEVKARHADIASYALSRLTLKADGRSCTLHAGDQQVDAHSDGTYTVLHFTADCGGDVAVLEATYRLFFDFDAQHKGLLKIGRAHV